MKRKGDGPRRAPGRGVRTACNLALALLLAVSIWTACGWPLPTAELEYRRLERRNLMQPAQILHITRDCSRGQGSKTVVAVGENRVYLGQTRSYDSISEMEWDGGPLLLTDGRLVGGLEGSGGFTALLLGPPEGAASAVLTLTLALDDGIAEKRMEAGLGCFREEVYRVQGQLGENCFLFRGERHYRYRATSINEQIQESERAQLEYTALMNAFQGGEGYRYSARVELFDRAGQLIDTLEQTDQNQPSFFRAGRAAVPGLSGRGENRRGRGRRPPGRAFFRKLGASFSTMGGSGSPGKKCASAPILTTSSCAQKGGSKKDGK